MNVAEKVSRWLVILLLGFSVPAWLGCSTLASLGLPFGASSNKLIEAADQISDAPGAPIAFPKELAKEPLPAYIVEIGDTILVEPVKFDASIRLPGDQIVKPDGYFSLGEFGRHLAYNKTLSQIQIEVQQIIDAKIRQDFEIAFELERRERAAEKEAIESSRQLVDPDELNTADQENRDLPLLTSEDREARLALERRISEAIRQNEISARLVNWDSKKIYVLGEVNSPGSFTYLGNETVLDALVEAGGMTTKANRHQIILSRPTPCSSCRIVLKVCYDQIVQLGDASTNYQLQPGDRVFVPSLSFCDDVRQSLGLEKNDRCPRCGPCQQGCALPTGCE